MVSEDPQTFDIHADLVGGWPTIVHPLLRQMKRLNYNYNDLSDSLKTNMKVSLQKLLKKVEDDSHRPESKELAVG